MYVKKSSVYHKAVKKDHIIFKHRRKTNYTMLSWLLLKRNTSFSYNRPFPCSLAKSAHVDTVRIHRPYKGSNAGTTDHVYRNLSLH